MRLAMYDVPVSFSFVFLHSYLYKFAMYLYKINEGAWLDSKIYCISVIYLLWANLSSILDKYRNSSL